MRGEGEEESAVQLYDQMEEEADWRERERLEWNNEAEREESRQRPSLALVQKASVRVSGKAK